MKTKRVLRKIAALSTGAAMLGATMTGALALSYTLADYPAPFIKSGIFSGVIAVGQDAAASDTIGQSVLLADLQVKAVSPSGGTTVSVSGGVTEDIPLGSNVSDSQSYTLDVDLADDDIDSLIDSSITYASADYDVEEVVVINQAGNTAAVETSLTSSEDDYQTDVVLEVARDGLKYYYAFSESINLNATSASDPLEIKFLGKNLKITDIDNTDATKFTANVGSEYFLNSGDSIVSEGKTVKLSRIGSGGAIVVDVDGVTETISSSSTKTVNGIEIKNDETFYDSNNQAASAATLVVGKDAQETYKDGDAYAGEDKDNPDWVWNTGNLQTEAATTISTTAEFTGPFIGVENDFIFNDDSDNPPKIGECIDFPNNYISVCLDSLTVSDDNYATYTFEFDNSADLSDADGGLTSAQTIYIHTTQSEGLVVDQADLSLVNATTGSDIKTDKIWLYISAGGASAGINLSGNATGVGVFYKDTNDNKVKLAGMHDFQATGASFAHINYDNTKDTDLRMNLEANGASGEDILPTSLNLTLDPFHSTDLPDYNDNITMTFGLSSTKFSSLGTTASSEEANELMWFGSDSAGNTGVMQTLGTKDEDHRTRYGIIIRDPKSHGSSDEVVIDIPGDQVQANVVVKGSAASTTSSGGSVVVNPIPSTASALAQEVTSTTAQNVIVIGGPAVNPLAASVFGLTAADFTPNEAMVRLADNGNNVAMLVAGYSAVDTRNAAEAVAAGKLAGLNKVEAKVTSPSQVVGTYTIQ
ncbi:MAG TPA: hypothetical protein VJH20_01275 [Candidatus Nanoarchaeia archaeon]|nr:hypothetical protein [Candidatus Nanoarchaeia archaeon]